MTAAILFFALAVQDAPPSVEQIQTWSTSITSGP
jgi:hypothetical protein